MSLKFFNTKKNNTVNWNRLGFYPEITACFQIYPCRPIFLKIYGLDVNNVYILVLNVIADPNYAEFWTICQKIFVIRQCCFLLIPNRN